jgi:hypothetical protein
MIGLTNGISRITYQFISLIIIASLSAACAREDPDELSRDIAQSVKVGKGAASEVPAYGFPVYPHAQVTSSLMGGMTLGFTADATKSEIASFYSDELARRGYAIEKQTVKDHRLTIWAYEPKSPRSKMTVAISSKTENGPEYIVMFVKSQTTK